MLISVICLSVHACDGNYEKECAYLFIYLFICLASRCSQALDMGSGPMLSLQQLSSNNVIFSTSCDNV